MACLGPSGLLKDWLGCNCQGLEWSLHACIVSVAGTMPKADCQVVCCCHISKLCYRHHNSAMIALSRDGRFKDHRAHCRYLERRC